jgi:GAF domain-containing protein
LAAITPEDLWRLRHVVAPLTSCYSSGETTGLTFVGGSSLQQAGACAVIVLPLATQGRRIGLAILANTGPRSLDADIVEPAELLATLAGACLGLVRPDDRPGDAA